MHRGQRRALAALAVLLACACAKANAVDVGPASWAPRAHAEEVTLRAVSQCKSSSIPFRTAADRNLDITGSLLREVACGEAPLRHGGPDSEHQLFTPLRMAPLGSCSTLQAYTYVISSTPIGEAPVYAGHFATQCTLGRGIESCGHGLDLDAEGGLALSAQGAIYQVDAVSLDANVWVDNLLPETPGCNIGPFTPPAPPSPGPLPAGSAWRGFAVIASGPMTVYDADGSAPSSGWFENVIAFVPYTTKPTIPLSEIAGKRVVSQFDYNLKFFKADRPY